MARNYLPNGNYYTDLSVNPKNWKSVKAPTRKPWFIFYRFYSTDGQNKLVTIRGMNVYKTQLERMQAAQVLIDDELHQLTALGYNPITKIFTPFYDPDTEITPEMPLPQALDVAKTKLKCDPDTVKDLGYALNFIKTAINHINLNRLPVGQVSRKYIVRILEACGAVKETWTAATFNKYRTYLIMLFKVLVKYEALENNPVLSIEKEVVIRKLRDVVTPEQRRVIAKHLKENYYSFYRFLQIFFHSGGRIKEMLRLQVKDIDLDRQLYKVTVRKGRAKEVLKTIKNIALPYWRELIEGADPEDYVFSAGLVPGKEPIRREQISKRWRIHVKEKLLKLYEMKIIADFYSLKHLNTTEVTKRLSEEDAARLNSHDSTAMVVKIYDVGREDRQHERLKNVGNEF
ncbi:MAG TPA: tyrosine-type recombinase/integrase [Flavitalea sp.]|nr:tyrosine-type recombinase/integrase [Flavitalea sp.]